MTVLYYGLLLSLFLEYFRPDAFIPAIGATKIGTIVPLVTFTFTAFLTKPISNTAVLREPNTKWIGFFLFLLIVSILASDVTNYSWGVFKRVLGYVFWYIMFVKLVTDLPRLRKVIVVLVVAHFLLLLLNPAVILQPDTRSYVRGAPFLGDGNDFALSLCVLLPLCIWLFLTAKSKVQRSLYAGGVIALVLAVIGTQSRGASLALAGVLGFLWWRGQRKFAGVVLIALVGLMVVSFAPPQYFERMSTITEYQQESSAMGRIIAWKAATRMAIKYPLTGVGSGHFPVALGTEFKPPEYGDRNLPWLTAHSMYFLVLGELGLPGLICLLALLIGNYFRLSRLARESASHTSREVQDFRKLFLMLGAALIGFCIGGAFLSVTYYPHLYVLCGLFVAATNIYKDAVGHANGIGDIVRDSTRDQ